MKKSLPDLMSVRKALSMVMKKLIPKLNVVKKSLLKKEIANKKLLKRLKFVKSLLELRYMKKRLLRGSRMLLLLPSVLLGPGML